MEAQERGLSEPVAFGLGCGGSLECARLGITETLSTQQTVLGLSLLPVHPGNPERILRKSQIALMWIPKGLLPPQFKTVRLERALDSGLTHKGT